MHALCNFANEQEGVFVHPVVRSTILHFMIGYDHPFIDGNGRTARALFYWSMLRYGYWLAEFISISHIMLQAPAQYALAYLFTETDERDLTYFLLYHTDVVRRAVANLHEYIARKTAEIERLDAELAGIQLLNHRQRSLIRHAVRHPGASYTVEGHRREYKVSYETARGDLVDLVTRGLLASHRDRKKFIFTPLPQLEGRLASIAGRDSATLR
jgi:Fic family protein